VRYPVRKRRKENNEIDKMNNNTEIMTIKIVIYPNIGLIAVIGL
jgi:hypothetical protein